MKTSLIWALHALLALALMTSAWASSVTIVGGGPTDVCSGTSVSVSVVPDKTPPGPTECCSNWNWISTDYTWTGASGSSSTATVDTSHAGSISVSVSMVHHWVCSDDEGTTNTTTEEATPLTITVHDLAISGPTQVGILAGITLSASGQAGVTWSASTTGGTVAIAPPSSDGSVVVTGETAGPVTITATDGTCSGTLNITVTPSPPPTVSISSSKLYLQIGAATADSTTFTVTGGTGPYTWNSSQTTVAGAVVATSTTGTVTAASASGTTSITATDHNNVTSNPVTVTGYKIITTTSVSVPGAPDSRTTVGIGELVNYSTQPIISGLTWTTNGTAINEPSYNVFAAGQQTESDDLTVAGAGGLSGKLTFSVLAPNGVQYKNPVKMHQNGSCNGGFKGYWLFLPSNVSFHEMEFKEEPATATGTDYFHCIDGTSVNAGATSYTAISDTDNSSTIQDISFTSGCGTATSYFGTLTVTGGVKLDYLVNSFVKSNFMQQIPNQSSNATGTVTSTKTGLVSPTSFSSDINDPTTNYP